MQKKSRISFGPGAASIILIVVVLSMSVLGLLSLVNSRNDRKLSERSAQVIEAVYELNEQAEIMFADLDSIAAGAARSLAGEAGSEAKPDSGAALPAQLAAAIKAALPEGVAMDGDTLSWVMRDDLRDLECAAQIIFENGDAALKWTTHRLVMRTEDTWNLGIF